MAARRAADRGRAIVGLLSCCTAFLWVGCGLTDGGEVRENEQADARDKPQVPGQTAKQRGGRPVAWRLLNARGRTVVIGKVLGYCYGAPKPRVGRVQVDESAEAVVLTMLLENPPRKKNGRACLGRELSLGETVRLEANINGRPIFDGSTSPPTRR